MALKWSRILFTLFVESIKIGSGLWSALTGREVQFQTRKVNLKKKEKEKKKSKLFFLLVFLDQIGVPWSASWLV
jgi:hypothetical protein